VQRRALDRFGGVDLEPLLARKELAAIDERLAGLGGDERERARRSTCWFQIRELDAAPSSIPTRTSGSKPRRTLATPRAIAEAAGVAVAAPTTDGGSGESVAAAIAALDGRAPFAEAEARLRSVAAELTDLVSDIRSTGEAIEDDPERQEAVRARRRLLFELKRKYGDSLAEVMAFHQQTAERLTELETRDATAAALDAARRDALVAIAGAEAEVGAQRRAAAPRLAAATEANLQTLAMPRARLEVAVGDDPGDDVTFRIAANPGSPPLPLAKVASGGELARAMLALRLVLTEAPDTLVFDEVDAGIGGEAAIAVGRALGALADRHQVLVVTHLPQVAAFADAQVQVTKTTRRSTTTTAAAALTGDERAVELARMLSGTPGSDVARAHAEELLADAEAARTQARRRRRRSS
jgi:DNA repair protein RecN (Recombination protein N)